MNKKILGLVFLMIFLFIAGCGSKEVQDKVPVKEEKLAVNPFSPATDCSFCHDQFYNEWRGTMHNLAFTDPFYAKMAEVASRETEGLTDKYCANCHIPIGVHTGQVPPVDGSGADTISLEGVSCDFCHAVEGAKGIGNGSFIVNPGGAKYGNLADADSPMHKTVYVELFKKAEFCGMCHSVSHPTNGLPLETTYEEWKNGPYAKEGIVCQDCHMTPTPGVKKPNPGKVARQGRERNHIYTHTFVGGNFWITEIMGAKEVAKLARERLQAAAKVEIVNVTKQGGMTKIKVRVSNVGAGHYLPTGLTESRQLWLEVTAYDGNGREVYSSGKLDQDGMLPEGTVIYHTEVVDESGQVTEKFWRATKILKDYRIPPKGYREEEFTLPNSYGRVIVKLNYRSANQAFLDELFGERKYTVPYITIAQTRKKY